MAVAWSLPPPARRESAVSPPEPRWRRAPDLPGRASAQGTSRCVGGRTMAVPVIREPESNRARSVLAIALPHDASRSAWRAGNGLCDGARSRNRTGMGLPPADFKSDASTNFATRAYGQRTRLRARIMIRGGCRERERGAGLSHPSPIRPRINKYGAGSVGHLLALAWEGRSPTKNARDGGRFQRTHRLSPRMEAWVGIEPAYAALQAAA